MSKPYIPIISTEEFLKAKEYSPIGSFWVDPVDNIVLEATALEMEGWPEAAKEVEEELE